MVRENRHVERKKTFNIVGCVCQNVFQLLSSMKMLRKPVRQLKLHILNHTHLVKEEEFQRLCKRNELDSANTELLHGSLTRGFSFPYKKDCNVISSFSTNKR